MNNLDMVRMSLKNGATTPATLSRVTNLTDSQIKIAVHRLRTKGEVDIDRGRRLMLTERGNKVIAGKQAEWALDRLEAQEAIAKREAAGRVMEPRTRFLPTQMITQSALAARTPLEAVWH